VTPVRVAPALGTARTRTVGAHSDHRDPTEMTMSQHSSTLRVAELFELRYCFLCDAEGPHLSTEVEGVYVFQCSTCFATHVEQIPAPAGRHRI
jgi:hypothetical protein